MVTTRDNLRLCPRDEGFLADRLAHVNEQNFEDTSGRRFMIILLMVLDGQSRRPRWASADATRR